MRRQWNRVRTSRTKSGAGLEFGADPCVNCRQVFALDTQTLPVAMTKAHV